MNYIDANIFIFPILEETPEAQYCKKILSQIASQQIIGFTSVLTWDEIVWVIKKEMGKEDAVNEGKKFIEFPYLKLLEVNQSTIAKAQELMEKYNLNPRDSIHAASALLARINQVISDDSDFDKIKELKRIQINKF